MDVYLADNAHDTPKAPHNVYDITTMKNTIKYTPTRPASIHPEDMVDNIQVISECHHSKQDRQKMIKQVIDREIETFTRRLRVTDAAGGRMRGQAVRAGPPKSMVLVALPPVWVPLLVH